MTHKSSVVINRTVVEGEDGAIVEAVVTYRPPHSAGPKEVGQMVARITRRMDALADAFPDE